jgi:hypothetical protein
MPVEARFPAAREAGLHKSLPASPYAPIPVRQDSPKALAPTAYCSSTPVAMGIHFEGILTAHPPDGRAGTSP